MSGDIQTRQRRKEKKKAKRDEPAIGVDISKFSDSEKSSVQMHLEDDHDHGVGWCAKIVFFILMAILAGLIGLIVIENQGASDVDVPLSDSRFSEYLQGWVEETREQEHHEDHHQFVDHDDHDEEEHAADTHDDDEHLVPDDEPYPEEKDSNSDENNESENLNAEINHNVDDDDEEEPAAAEDQLEPENDIDDEPEQDQIENDETHNGDEEMANLFEDSSAPFEEEQITKPVITVNDLTNQVDELENNLSEIAKMLGKDSALTKTKPKSEKKKEDSDQNDIEDENVVDNDAGEDVLLQKIAEEIEAAAAQQENDVEDHEATEATDESSHRSDNDETVSNETINRQILCTRRLTVLNAAEERLIDDKIDNEEIIEVMMVSGHQYEDYEDDEDSEGESSYNDEEDQETIEYEEEIVFTPKTFEDYNTLFKKIENDAEPEAVDVDTEAAIEKELLKLPERTTKAETPESEISPDEINQGDEVYDEDELMDEEFLEEEEEEFEPENPDDIEELSEEEEQDDIEYDEECDSEELDVDDDELLKRLEAKYGKLESKNDEDDEETWTKVQKEGGSQSYMDEFMNEDDNDNFDNNPELKQIYEKAKELDKLADKYQSNERLIEAIDIYKDLILNHNTKLNDKILKKIAKRCIERMRFLGKLKAVVEIHKKLIERFPDEPSFQNDLAVTYLLGNRLSASKRVLHEVLLRWRYDGFALVHYGFILKNLDLEYEDAILYLQEGIDSNEPGTQDSRFYFHLGDALQRLGRDGEARKVFQKGAEKKLFLSEYQRSLYNVEHLKSRPFWTKVETTYKDQLMEIQKYWHIIRDEGLKLLSENELFINESENLKDTGDWKQLELFARGIKTKNCIRAPFTCKIIENFEPAAGCKRGQVKFSVLHPGTHVFSHCGPTNCRIRAHLGLKVPEKTFLRVANETKSWRDGQWLIFDDSFEHEVWHNGTSVRLILIVDVWHPDLTEAEKKSLSSI